MSTYPKLDAKTKRMISKMSMDDLIHAEHTYKSKYESAYYDAIVAEIKRRKELSK